MKDNQINWYDFDQYLSFKDLEKLDCWRNILVAGDEVALKELIFKHGCDLEYGYQIVSQYHVTRTRPYIQHFGPRIVFKERTDADWMGKYMAVEDIARVHTSSFVRAGMTESLNSGLHLADFIEDELSKHVRYLEMKNEEKKGKE